MTTSTDADTAVRNYLLFLEDPAQLVDNDEIVRLQAEVDAATDPLDKLRSLSKLNRAQQSDEGALRAAFCEHARAWTEANEVNVASLRSLGVTDEVLRQAGFATPSPGGRARKTGSYTRAAGAAPTVTAAQIKTQVAARTGRFTLAEIGADIGGSPMTVRKAITDLVADGLVRRLGPSSNWSHQGRAPIVYQTITPRDASDSER